MGGMITTTGNASSRESVVERWRPSPANGPSAAAKEPEAEKGETSPATRVELSDGAKAMLERARIGQAVADRLAETLAASAGRGGAAQKPRGGVAANGVSQFLRSVTGGNGGQGNAPPSKAAQVTPRSSAAWENYAPYGDPTISDQEFLGSIKDTLLAQAEYYDQSGQPPEVGQALRDAIRNGTVTVQRASQVEGLNFHSTQSFTPSVHGGGYDSIGGTTQNPTGATKQAIDQGRAIAMWHQDRGDIGDIYVSW